MLNVSARLRGGGGALSLSLSVKYHVPNEHANVHDASMDATMPNGIGSRLAQARLDNCLVA